MTVAARRALIVEDSPVERKLVRALLAAMPEYRLTVDEAENAEQGMQLLNAHGYDIIVADYHLGGPVTGADVLARAKHLQPECRRILLTGDGSARVAEQATRDGAAQRILLKTGSSFQVLQHLKQSLST